MRSTGPGDGATSLLLARIARAAEDRPPGRYSPADLGEDCVSAVEQTLATHPALTRMARDLGARWSGAPEIWVLPRGSRAPHVQGSLWAWPGVAVYRVLLSIDVAGPSLKFSLNDTPRIVSGAGSAVAWDVDRDPAGLSAEQRSVVLVTHAVVGGGALGRWLGRARVAARRAPVDPEPLSPVDRARDWLVERCGGTNLLYALLLLAASAVTRSPVPFVFGISFVHYLVYVATFHQRRGVAFPAFVRDALFFKTLSMTCLGLVWLSEARLEPVTALSLAVIAAGVGLSMAAARALGFERTYFGVELGRLAWRKVEQWPYGVVPHPMIVGASIALVGVLLLPGVREGWPWLVPMHLGLYLVHLVQEIRATPS